MGDSDPDRLRVADFDLERLREAVLDLRARRCDPDPLLEYDEDVEVDVGGSGLNLEFFKSARGCAFRLRGRAVPLDS